MSVLVAPDISHYQPTITASYPRDFVIFKATQGTYYLDPHFLVNAGNAAALYERGHLAGAVAYHVFTGESVSVQFARIKQALGPNPPRWCLGVMIDLESWAGTPYALKGDHSTAVNALGAAIAAYFGGNWRSAWLYGNRYDLAYLAPRRDVRMPKVLAAYSPTLSYTTLGGSAIGQQYSDGESKYAVPFLSGVQLPRATDGLGNCDHNVFPAYADGFALRTWIRGTQPSPLTFLEKIMALDKNSQDYKDFMADVEKAANEGAGVALAHALHYLGSGADSGRFTKDAFPNLPRVLKDTLEAAQKAAAK